jgi:hypothetical protein
MQIKGLPYIVIFCISLLLITCTSSDEAEPVLNVTKCRVTSYDDLLFVYDAQKRISEYNRPSDNIAYSFAYFDKEIIVSLNGSIRFKIITDSNGNPIETGVKNTTTGEFDLIATYEYNSDGTLKKYTYDKNNVYVYTYNSDKNIVKIEIYDTRLVGNVIIADCKYDTKSNPFNADGFKGVRGIPGYGEMTLSKNNLIEKSVQGNINTTIELTKYSYSYNSDGLPDNFSIDYVSGMYADHDRVGKYTYDCD